jgi:hypothetical protein
MFDRVVAILRNMEGLADLPGADGDGFVCHGS